MLPGEGLGNRVSIDDVVRQAHFEGELPEAKVDAIAEEFHHMPTGAHVDDVREGGPVRTDHDPRFLKDCRLLQQRELFWKNAAESHRLKRRGQRLLVVNVTARQRLIFLEPCAGEDEPLAEICVDTRIASSRKEGVRKLAEALHMRFRIARYNQLLNLDGPQAPLVNAHLIRPHPEELERGALPLLGIGVEHHGAPRRNLWRSSLEIDDLAQVFQYPVTEIGESGLQEHVVAVPAVPDSPATVFPH